MPRTKGTKQFGAEITAELVDEVKAFATKRGETVRRVIEAALRRHMDNPPPVVPPPPPVYPPLPPVTVPRVGKREKK